MSKAEDAVHEVEHVIEEAVHGANEYEREPVPEKARKGAGKFWGMYAGEHAAGTEFMIGPLFLLSGVTLQNIFVGLLLGNLLAVLSWRYLCAPIATKARMTLYFQLEKIAGGGLVKLYNFFNGVLFCFLAGAMITVSATAVGVPFNMPMPSVTDVGPGSAAFVLIVLVVGAVIAVVAAKGYETVARFANVASPWMILIFLACGVVSLVQLEVSSFAELQTVWTGSINFSQALAAAPFEVTSLTGLLDLLKAQPDLVPKALEAFQVASLEDLAKVTAATFQGAEAKSTMSLMEVTLFAWFCNAAMHVGMSDLSVFRYAKKSSYGWASSAGMFIGHYMAWIAAAFMLAAQIKLTQDANPVPGPMAYKAVGWAGIICVIVAGWTTANPTIYRAGLAFQAMVPKSPRVLITLLAGALATVAGIFPAFAWKLLGFVGLYGTILAPMGAVIFFDWYFARKAGIQQFYAEKSGSLFNPAVLLAWLIPVGIALYFILQKGITTWLFPLPCWLACGLLYLLFSKFLQKRPA